MERFLAIVDAAAEWLISLAFSAAFILYLCCVWKRLDNMSSRAQRAIELGLAGLLFLGMVWFSWFIGP